MAGFFYPHPARKLKGTSNLLCFLALAPVVLALEEPRRPVEGIMDNSFLIEEAYNQEEGVVQHINTFMRQRHGDWLYTFTQEWPIGRHS